MNVLLVYPRYPDSFWSFRHALKFVGKKAAFPPLGLLTVAALFPDTWQARLIDQNVREVTDADLARADLVFVSAMTIQRDAVREILGRCRQLGVTTVAGGPLFTTAPEEFPEADHLVLNEAELTLPRLLDDLAMDRAQRIYTTEARADVTRTPLPRWESPGHPGLRGHEHPVFPGLPL